MMHCKTFYLFSQCGAELIFLIFCCLQIYAHSLFHQKVPLWCYYSFFLALCYIYARIVFILRFIWKIRYVVLLFYFGFVDHILVSCFGWLWKWNFLTCLSYFEFLFFFFFFWHLLTLYFLVLYFYSTTLSFFFFDACISPKYWVAVVTMMSVNKFVCVSISPSVLLSGNLSI